MNMIEARLMYIVSRLDSIEQKLDRLDGTLTGLSIKVYEDKNKNRDKSNGKDQRNIQNHK